jgi:hypothetical protein
VINPAASRPDGTDADYFAVKVLYPGVTKSMVHRFGGLQVLVSGERASMCLSRSLLIGPAVSTRMMVCGKSFRES